jgi:acetoin utilization deacetylase AcuC-like enzyme
VHLAYSSSDVQLTHGSCCTVCTDFNQSSTECAYLAAGSVVEITQQVLEGKLANGLAVVRPPGHHATCGCSMGFCVFNNVAVAARAAVREHWGGARRVLILDWDVHHGNGTQKMFESDSSVLYVSIHRYDEGEFFPGGTRGHFANAGLGTGRGCTVNIPWDCSSGPGGSPGDAEYALAFEQIVEPVSGDFRPDIILVSAGFDAAVGDPLGGCRVTPKGFYEMTRRLQALPSAKGRVIIALEGGYNLKSTARSMAACAAALLGDACPTFEDVPTTSTCSTTTSKQGATTSQGKARTKRPAATSNHHADEQEAPTHVDGDNESFLQLPPGSLIVPTGTTVAVAAEEGNDGSGGEIGPRFRDRIEEVRAALSLHWPSLRVLPEPSQSPAAKVRSPSSSEQGVVAGEQLRLRCGNSYRRLSSSNAKEARTGPPGVKLIHEWTLYVRLADEEDGGGNGSSSGGDTELAKKIARVEFRLDESFNSAVIVVIRPPFAVARRSWTTGVIGVTVFFKSHVETNVAAGHSGATVGGLGTSIAQFGGSEAWGGGSSAASSGGGDGDSNRRSTVRCRPSGPPPRPAELSHALCFADAGKSSVYTITIGEELLVPPRPLLAVAAAAHHGRISGGNGDDDNDDDDDDDDDWDAMTPQERRRAALRRRRRQNAQERERRQQLLQQEGGNCHEEEEEGSNGTGLGHSTAVGALFFAR